MASDEDVAVGNSCEQGPSAFVETEDQHPLREFGGNRKKYF